MSRAFLDALRELRGGTSIDELSTQLTELVARVREAGRGGKLTYTITVKPAGKGDTNALMLEDAIAVKAPALERGSTILFANEDHQLSRKDPRQPEITGLRDVTSFPPSTKDAKEAAGS